ncbi:epoxyqueuosine reductase [Altererythrobacter atlanticus]|uniref:Epoxyqueuosine reductase n=1 Tax=Croceibacterium atlanticum TaxID=1267766 RepID=A0A0F7KRS7_9SPHN|nr:tRNA epoxyqueuosine(34) reductase QueG [Croceibacterium atlanticum]AKH43173.1 Epoxyqueuosine reductase [Croceibacterium atlanticum]MBB5732122.1 epoxyqueuosine reductase [Croceibacterium atlanticum]
MIRGPDLVDLKARLVDQARLLGFATIGFAPAADNPEQARRLREWLDAGMHGEMQWMEDRADVRQGPQSMWPDAQSVLALGMSYAPDCDPLALEGDAERARISVYAQGRDYHDVVKKALKALARWLVAEAEKIGLEVQLKVFVDTAPVMEKPLGQAAGIGWQGKHTNLVSREHGSWLFLGAIYTTLPFPPDEAHPDRCGNCTACQQACPTNAFPEPYRLDARRCISYLTIEHKGPIPHEFREAMGNRIYGCDDCLAVCPWNKFAGTAARHKALAPREELAAPHLAELLALDDPAFRQKFSGSPIKRVGRDRFVRNCLIAAGNSGNPDLAGPVRALLDDPDPVVAEAARWAVARLTASL